MRTRYSDTVVFSWLIIYTNIHQYDRNIMAGEKKLSFYLFCVGLFQLSIQSLEEEMDSILMEKLLNFIVLLF